MLWTIWHLSISYQIIVLSSYSLAWKLP
jgi:hypothetical protein